MPKQRGGRPHRPSQSWSTFIRKHLAGPIAIDFFTVPTVTFEILYMFVVLSLDRRQVLHVNVTAHPYAEWAGQQIVEAFGEEGAFKFLIRDRDRIFSAAFDRRVNSLGCDSSESQRVRRGKTVMWKGSSGRSDAS